GIRPSASEQRSARVRLPDSDDGEYRYRYLESAQRQIERRATPPRASVRAARSVRGFLRRGMKAHLTRRYLFSASHRLHTDALTVDQNRAVFGKCNNPHGHGHNYALEVTVSGQVNPATGMVCNMVELDDAVRREILERFDHV